MKKTTILLLTLFSTSAFAGNNIMNLSPHNVYNLTPSGANNIAFESVAVLSDHNKVKEHKPNIDKVAKGKLTGKIIGKPINKLEAIDEFPIDEPGDGVIIDDNDEVVVITTDPREWKGIEEGGWVPELEPRCACIGIDHIPFDDLQHELPVDDSSNNIIY
jgi:hypothetical protein